MKKIMLVFVVALAFCSMAMASDIAFYVGPCNIYGWYDASQFDDVDTIIAETGYLFKDIQQFDDEQLDEFGAWIDERTNDGVMDIIWLNGTMPSVLYPFPNLQPDGSRAEEWLDGGNMFVNVGNWVNSVIGLGVQTLPIPADGARIGNRIPVLYWNPGGVGLQHDVYFGTNSRRVDSANRWDTPGVYRGRWIAPSYATEELEIGQTYYWCIDDVQGLGQDIFFIAIALGDCGLDGNALEDFKVQMVLDGPMLIIDPQGPGDLRQTLRKGPVNGGENAGQVFKLLMVCYRLELRAELFDDFQHFGNRLEVLEALEFVFLYFMPFFAHQRHLNRSLHSAQV